MKADTESTITLPPAELKLLNALLVELKAKSKIEVVRRGLLLLKETTERESLRDAYRRASAATRGSHADVRELDRLAGEGLADW